MKRRISVFMFVCLCGLMFFCSAFWRALTLHKEYPDPKMQTCQMGETLRHDNYEITFSGWQWGDGSLISGEFPDFVPAGDQGGPEDVRVGLITLTIRKSSECTESFDLANISFSSGSWGNQFDLELFYMLNPTWNSLTLDLKDGEEQSAVLPITMLRTQFSTKEWEMIDSREIYINVWYYPEHHRFVCPVEQD